MERSYIAIDLKSFYASVECIERGLNPLTANLVVADASRTEKTICLAVSPSLKSFGIPGRARLFEVVQRVKEINAKRLCRAPGRKFTGSSSDINELKANPSLSLNYIVATPHMAHYIQCSTEIYKIYLRFIAPEDIHVYSIDEVFMDVTNYLKTYELSPHDLAMKIIRQVLKETGITATAGIGTNLYLSKIAMDIVAKHMSPDNDGVRIAELDEMSYRRKLWLHRPLTDFWRIGHGYANRLNKLGLYTMGDIARYSLNSYGENQLYKEFGVNAELLIDHAWGWEPCRISDIKAYIPENTSISSGQVLQSPHTFENAKLVVREMADSLSLDLVDKRLCTDQIVLTIGYDTANLDNSERRNSYAGDVATDHYGRIIPKQSHGSVNLGRQTSSSKLIINATMELFDRLADPTLLVRRMYILANHVVTEDMNESAIPTQLDLFADYDEPENNLQTEKEDLDKERKQQETIIAIQKKYGKNAILKGLNFEDGATGRERNSQIGGHKA